MTKFAHDDVKPFQQSVLEKKEQVAEMFNDIATKYDFLNRFLSAGIDVSWRKKAIKRLENIAPQKILDVATGTADVALMLNKMLQPEQIVGIDISEGMLKIGREKIEKAGLTNKIILQKGDSENLPFDDNSFDAVTVAFGVRNFQNLEKGVAEMWRVLRPNGKLIVLEFSRPKQKLFKSFYRFYMNVVTPNAGKIFSKNKDAYQYLNESVSKFPERDEFVKVLNGTKFKNTLYKPLTMGICCIYEGKK
ncbi:bifunctional demethylmenaquinone methyltransferase/2-methoxy-6-polyprenyl-1,4-benzoquinol methylase [Arachidicoccus ginsenosidimutans]|uniref:bifunctional demethylmenaquinone methyltransferase/2-methoxy-6-polyprenyl-1,4-benzoquinol methylase UbiE n=1 Tax=Arachidicoccus sp. BS20 TaxID=1850526 RepID=UPI0007F0C02A|nr:bifunctional demethylmenaquinone methyltransferase/2-methoxy-6-polyprenyl-1,4-benzoquinol methylase UbiE [Arachidicoccus sp. BS20]ANI87965.1 bifunctional demethylmenaquinone methyltransferase/2-methoxy-6-polyprenyl-1,4-benzoquinol methylase [Arachidicoccus sp. BS20]